MTAIPTTYRGIRYRSRLEARWAAFMSNIGWEHTYEPFDGDGYIPDFIVYGARPLFIEVKPAVTIDDYLEPHDKVAKGLAAYAHDAIIVGSNWRTKVEWIDIKNIAGFLHEYDTQEWDFGAWNLCGNCHVTCVYHVASSWHGRPCGCHDGDHYLLGVNSAFMDASWAEAVNDVQWRGRCA